MKQYPKLYEDLYDASVENIRTRKITSTFGSPDILSRKFIDFYKEAHLQLFDMIVKQIWLEQHFLYGTERRQKRMGSGHSPDWAFGQFMKTHVGISQKPITHSILFASISTYLIDFFPDFLKHDPFKEPEYYKYPFENITLDHLHFVYQVVDMRADMLKYAEEQKMSYMEFSNWVTNHVLCNNDETGKTKYELAIVRNLWQHIRNNDLKHGWFNEKMKFKQ